VRCYECGTEYDLDGCENCGCCHCPKPAASNETDCGHNCFAVECECLDRPFDCPRCEERNTGEVLL
jgi:hypothetical protein